MNDKKKKRELTNEEIDENIFEMCNICSTTDCTGLIQVVPRTEAELESYEEFRVLKKLHTAFKHTFFSGSPHEKKMPLQIVLIE